MDSSTYFYASTQTLLIELLRGTACGQSRRILWHCRLGRLKFPTRVAWCSSWEYSAPLLQQLRTACRWPPAGIEWSFGFRRRPRRFRSARHDPEHHARKSSAGEGGHRASISLMEVSVKVGEDHGLGSKRFKVGATRELFGDQWIEPICMLMRHISH